MIQGDEAQLPAIVNGAESIPADEEYSDDKLTQDHMRYYTINLMARFKLVYSLSFLSYQGVVSRFAVL
jgi:hypothetical protein